MFSFSRFFFTRLTFYSFFIKETPEPFPLPTEVTIVKAASGWAHCVAVTGKNHLLIFLAKEGTLYNVIKMRRDKLMLNWKVCPFG